MITITLQRDKEKRITGFDISGHAGYGEAGSDIVCAAVSALAQSALLGLLDYDAQHVQYDVGEGSLSVHVMKDGVAPQAILRAMELGLTEISQQYSEYVILHS